MTYHNKSKMRSALDDLNPIKSRLLDVVRKMESAGYYAKAEQLSKMFGRIEAFQHTAQPEVGEDRQMTFDPKSDHVLALTRALDLNDAEDRAIFRQRTHRMLDVLKVEFIWETARAAGLKINNRSRHELTRAIADAWVIDWQEREQASEEQTRAFQERQAGR